MIIRLKQGSISGKPGSELITHGPVYPNIDRLEVDGDGVVKKLFFHPTKATPATILAYGGSSIEEKFKWMNYSSGYVDGHLLYSELEQVEGVIGDEIWESETLSEFMETLYGNNCESDEPGNQFNRLLNAWALSRCAPYKRSTEFPIETLLQNREFLKMQVLDPSYGGSVAVQVNSMKFKNFILPMILRLASDTGLLNKVNAVELSDIESIEHALTVFDNYLYDRVLKKNQRLFISDIMDIPFSKLKPGEATLRSALGEDTLKKLPVEQVMEVAIKVWLTC